VLPRQSDERRAYADAKTTLAVVTSPPSTRRPQPIPPSADWQFHVAQGCPAHCQYCYLAGSLSGPPLTRAYANLPEILEELSGCVGRGTVTSANESRRDEGTTFEMSCYTDPLGIEHLTGALEACIRHFGAWQAPVRLRWTTKYSAVDSLLGLPHSGRTRVRFSVNAPEVVRQFEGGTSSTEDRLVALGKMAAAGYPVGLTIAPIIPIEDWREQYTILLQGVASAIASVADIDLSVEMITHRFTGKSKDVLLGWYPRTPLDMDEARRSMKRTKFGTSKYVYPAALMKEMKSWFEQTIPQHLPTARILYWT
jgi:spore photoproduct lyase